MERIAGTPTKSRRDFAAVRERVGLPVTVGIARTKFLAKVASAVAKPDGLLARDARRRAAFLHPLPVERMWGVGPATATRLPDADFSVGDLARVPRPALAAGSAGPQGDTSMHSRTSATRAWSGYVPGAVRSARSTHSKHDLARARSTPTSSHSSIA